MSISVSARRRMAGAAAALAVLAAGTLPAAPAAAATGGYVRLAHLSPDTPAVDVYLKSRTGSVDQTFPAVGYGALSDYLRLPAGAYSVAMRKAGADPGTKPVLTTQVTVEEDGAYTVAGVGRYADLGLRVLEDDLKLPAPGESKVRIIQASVRAPVLDVDVNNGPDIADGVQFATTTPYRAVKPGRWNVRVQPSGGGVSSTLPCTLGAGSVYSLLVLDAKNGALKPELHIDAGRQGTVPLGGVATGAGGSQSTSPVWMALLVAGLAAVLTGGLVVVVRRRPRPVWAAPAGRLAGRAPETGPGPEPANPGAPKSGSSTAGSSTAGSSTAGSSTAGPVAAGSSTACPGAAGSGVAGSSTAGR
ncbi:DUF4397 domain-containing protein [Jidongwangia harbinensis]|uniref:DUF4397 domain-containing protein n=1 Tax=Jidongwangia harbinensis TaxID=2878561 RepID=UPI001CD9F478|nr:DUF4397 domain-containing protein [Jidongwangia harbinensis]MCA2215268.1 DUF4397 domain-containing protein [Jidongwangia harbinensis]